MDLVTRGRLSVQRVKQEEWDAINQLAEQGGWEEIDLKKLGTSGTKSVKSASRGQSSKSVTRGKKASRKDRNNAETDDTNVGETSDPGKGTNATRGTKRRKIMPEQTRDGVREDESEATGSRRSKRRKQTT
jgi:hypothetical protein